MQLFSSTVRLQTTRGQAMTIAAVFFLIISLTIVLGMVSPVQNQVEMVRASLEGAESFYAAEGVREDVIYRLMNNLSVDAVETLLFGDFSATATTTTVADGKEVSAQGNRRSYFRTGRAHLTTGSGTSFNYGIQSGEGGIILENTSSVVGNVFSNGSIDGAGSNIIKGDAISGGPSGLVRDIHATSSVYAHTIANATIDKDAYYQTISDSTVLGVLHPGAADQVTSSLPITDAKIEEWKNDAIAGGVISSPCPYEIDDDMTLGPIQINCDLEIDGSPVVTLAGAVWVKGNINIKNTAAIRVAASLGAKSVPVIADNPSNQTTSSKITLQNSAVIEGSGTSGSYVLFVSQNKSAEQGGSEKAINVQNSVDGDLLVYAGHGEVELQNSVKLKEVTAWRIRLKNSAEVKYETGLANLLFSGGPSGGYVFDGWREVE